MSFQIHQIWSSFIETVFDESLALEQVYQPSVCLVCRRLLASCLIAVRWMCYGAMTTFLKVNVILVIGSDICVLLQLLLMAWIDEGCRCYLMSTTFAYLRTRQAPFLATGDTTLHRWAHTYIGTHFSVRIHYELMNLVDDLFLRLRFFFSLSIVLSPNTTEMRNEKKRVFFLPAFNITSYYDFFSLSFLSRAI